MTIDSTLPAATRSTHRAIGYLVPAWDDALLAILDEDTAAARRVMRGAPARRSAIQVALTQAQRSPDVDGPLHVLAEAARINRLLSGLCQSVIARHADPLLAEGDCRSAAVIRLVGVRRLETLERASVRPLIDRAFVDGSRSLAAAAQALAGTQCEHGRAAGPCHDLSLALLEASRLAARSPRSPEMQS
ncbi:hypothetical protein [Aeromicrobium alkaliterrae]|uniref:DUF222 domain-containing protein n=1 Tax=Aeromicrobium alkaliterrae TaxID=302168 RepID=A0ABP4W2Y4_9ACTN